MLLFNKSMGQLADGSIPPGFDQLNLSFLNNLDHF